MQHQTMINPMNEAATMLTFNISRLELKNKNFDAGVQSCESDCDGELTEERLKTVALLLAEIIYAETKKD